MHCGNKKHLHLSHVVTHTHARNLPHMCFAGHFYMYRNVFIIDCGVTTGKRKHVSPGKIFHFKPTKYKQSEHPK